jgi:transglutaminase-like putative cysteine protease
MTAATSATTPGTSTTRRAGVHSRRTLDRATWIDLAVLTVLSLIAVLGFEPAFGPYNYLLAGVGGLVVGTAAALACYLFRFSIVSTVAIALGAYFVFGTPLGMPGSAIAGVLPSPTSLAGLVQGAVFGWPDIVTLQTPVEAPPYIAVVPYFASWLVAVVSVSVLCRWLQRKKRTPLRAGMLLIPAMVLYLAGILIGTSQPYLAGVRGIAFAGIALVWLGWRRASRGAVTITVDPTARRRKFTGVAIVVLGAVVLGGVGGVVLAPTETSRFVLRQEITPPFDPLQYPSPLAGFRNFTKKLAKTPLFTVSGLQTGEKIRMATLDSYDGQVWRVASPSTQTSDSGGFELLGRDIPAPPLATTGSTSTLSFRIDGYDDVWLPDAEYPSTLDFDAFTGVDPTTTVRINTVTGTAAVTSGVKKGLDYTVGIDTPALPNDKALATVAAAKLTLPPVTNVPDVVASKAEEYAGTAKTTIQQLRNIEKSLKTVGYLSHGLASDPVPSRAGEGSDRMAELFSKEPMVGDEEQYASAFALMARSLGYPSRVVMGFAPKVAKGQSSVTVTGKDVTAWSEVAFEGVGWVPFYPTPTKTDAPQEQTTKPKIEPQPQVRQPPDTTQKQDDVLTPVKISDKNPKDEDAAFSIPGWAYLLGGIIGIPLLAYFIPFLVIAAAKRRRRRSRLLGGTADRRVAGAWDELVDRYAELGVEVRPKSTRVQSAGDLEKSSREQGLALPEGGLSTLAATVDTAVFSSAAVDDDTVESTWTTADDAAAASFASAGWLRRRLAAFRYRRRR